MVALRQGRFVIWFVAATLVVFASACSSDGEGDTPDGGTSDSDVSDADASDADVEPDAETSSIETELFEQEGDGGATACLEPSVLVKALRERARQLDSRVHELDRRKRSLLLLTKTIEERLGGLESVRDKALQKIESLADIRAGRCREQEVACKQKVLALREEYVELEQGLERWDESQREAVDESREREVVRLTKAINSMRPEKAAATLGALDRETAALLISQLPERSSGKILAALEPTTTAEIVQTLLAKSTPPDRAALRAAAEDDEEDDDEDQAELGDDQPGPFPPSASRNNEGGR